MSKQTEKIKELIAKREQARLGGGQKAIDKQHQRGKYTARERIEMLVDEGSFEEYDMFKLHRCHNFGMEKKQFLGDGVVVGSATIDGRLVYVSAQDFTVNGGSLSETMSQKICKVMDMAMQNGAPMICINDSGGARIQEGICSLAGYGEIFERNILASGVIPQISGIFGPCAGGAVYSPALTDFILMMENTSYMFLTGPAVVKTVTGEDVDAEHLGGASVHASKSGVTSFTAKTEEEAMQMIKTLLSYIPSNNQEEAPRIECNDPIDRKEDLLNEIIPDDPNKAYDMYKVITALTDNGEFFEVQPKFAKNIIVGFARFNGQSVGVVANQPSAYAGVLDANASRKGARFVRFCDGLPAWNRSGVQCSDPSRCPASLCLRRSNGSQDYNHAAQVVWRQPYRDGLQAVACRPQLCMAFERDSRYGCFGCRGCALSQGSQGKEGSRRGRKGFPCRERARVHRPLRQPLSGRTVRLHRRCDRTAQHSLPHLSRTGSAGLQETKSACKEARMYADVKHIESA